MTARWYRWPVVFVLAGPLVGFVVSWLVPLRGDLEALSFAILAAVALALALGAGPFAFRERPRQRTLGDATAAVAATAGALFATAIALGSFDDISLGGGIAAAVAGGVAYTVGCARALKEESQFRRRWAVAAVVGVWAGGIVTALVGLYQALPEGG